MKAEQGIHKGFSFGSELACDLWRWSHSGTKKISCESSCFAIQIWSLRLKKFSYTRWKAWCRYCEIIRRQISRIYSYVCVYIHIWAFPRARSEESPANTEDTGDVGSISGSRRSTGEGNGNPFQYSFLGKSQKRGRWQATVHGLQRVTRQNNWAHMHIHVWVYIYGASMVAQMVKNLPAMQEIWVQSLGWEDPLEKDI